MFGHPTLFAGGQIFALVGNDDRIGVRLPDTAAHDEAVALDGSGVFDPMGSGKGMRHWVLLPAEMVDEPETLRKWVRRAHGLARGAGP